MSIKRVVGWLVHTVGASGCGVTIFQKDVHYKKASTFINTISSNFSSGISVCNH